MCWLKKAEQPGRTGSHGISIVAGLWQRSLMGKVAGAYSGACILSGHFIHKALHPLLCDLKHYAVLFLTSIAVEKVSAWI